LSFLHTREFSKLFYFKQPFASKKLCFISLRAFVRCIASH